MAHRPIDNTLRISLTFQLEVIPPSDGCHRAALCGTSLSFPPFGRFGFALPSLGGLGFATSIMGAHVGKQGVVAAEAMSGLTKLAAFICTKEGSVSIPACIQMFVTHMAV